MRVSIVKGDSMSYPIVRKGMVVTPMVTGYGSMEKYQKRFSRKDIAKLEKKLAKFQKTLGKLQSKTSRIGAKVRARRMARLDQKIQAIQALLGMQPFDASLQAEAMAISSDVQSPNYTPLIFGIIGAILIGGIVFTVNNKKKKGKKK